MFSKPCLKAQTLSESYLHLISYPQQVLLKISDNAIYRVIYLQNSKCQNQSLDAWERSEEVNIKRYQ